MKFKRCQDYVQRNIFFYLKESLEQSNQRKKKVLACSFDLTHVSLVRQENWFCPLEEGAFKMNSIPGGGNFVANKFRRGQILRRKNLVGFLKTARKNLVGISSDEICPLKFFLDEIPPGRRNKLTTKASTFFLKKK
jgi:hypothetical protein